MNHSEFEKLFKQKTNRLVSMYSNWQKGKEELTEIFDQFWRQSAGIKLKGVVLWGDSRFEDEEIMCVIAEEQGYDPYWHFYRLAVGICPVNETVAGPLPECLCVHPFNKDGSVSKRVFCVKPVEIYW